MKSIILSLRATVAALEYLALAIGITAAAALFVAIIVSVTARFFAIPIGGWIEQLPQLLFPWLVSAGFGIALFRNEHIAMEAVIGRLTGAVRMSVVWLITVAGCLLCVFLADQMWQIIAVVKTQNYPLLGISQQWGYWSIAYGLATLAIGMLSLTMLAMLDPDSRER